MRAILTEYLESPSEELFAKLTSEEQRYVERSKPAKAKKKKAPSKEEASQDEAKE